MNIAANAAFAKEAAAGRLLAAQQAYARCREQNNPYLPGNSLFGPTRTQMWGPDPCEAEMQELAGATTANQAAAELAQIQAAPTPQNLASAVAVQLADTWDSSELFDPVLMNVDLEAVQNMWSPTSIENVMEMIAVEMDLERASESDLEDMEIIYQNLIALIHWDPGYPTKPTKTRLVLSPKKQKWIGRWMPN
nr:nonstructural protein 2 [Canary chaphamaparvovirus 2]